MALSLYVGLIKMLKRKDVICALGWLGLRGNNSKVTMTTWSDQSLVLFNYGKSA